MRLALQSFSGFMLQFALIRRLRVREETRVQIHPPGSFLQERAVQFESVQQIKLVHRVVPVTIRRQKNG
jgi:hypothetical protein